MVLKIFVSFSAFIDRGDIINVKNKIYSVFINLTIINISEPVAFGYYIKPS